MRNALFDPIDYKFDESEFGTWRSHKTPEGSYYAEFRTHAEILGLPLVHITLGRSPETGRRVIARGVIAIGRMAVGVVGIGQLSLGIIAVGQLGLGLLLGLGQGTTGIIAIGQLALGVLFGLGQFTTGFIAIGQVAAGYYVLAQQGFGAHVVDMMHSTPEARQFFGRLIPGLR
jgi:hypothetical protein